MKMQSHQPTPILPNCPFPILDNEFDSDLAPVSRFDTMQHSVWYEDETDPLD